MPDCPIKLGPVRRRLIGELGTLRLLTHSSNWGVLGAYCGARSLWAEATEAIQKYCAMVKSFNGFPIHYIAIANRQPEIIMRIASEFGFTPASQCRISTSPPEDPALLHLLEGRSNEPGYDTRRPQTEKTFDPNEPVDETRHADAQPADTHQVTMLVG